MPTPRQTAGVIAGGALLAAAGYLGGTQITTDPVEPTNIPSSTNTPPAEPTPSPTIGPDEPTVNATKIAVIINENRGYNQVRKGMPWLKSIGDRFGQATNMKAMTHPSQPNYVWIAAGSSRGITSNTTSTKITGNTIMGKTILAKQERSAMVFAQSMSTDNCRMSQRGYYHPRHSYGWVLFKDERQLCELFMVGYDKIKPRITAGTLPNLTLIVPNNCSNSHDCSMATADRWSKTETERLMAGPDYKAGKLVIVITWDEDNKAEGNHIHTAVIHPSLDRKVVTTPLTLVSLHRTLARFGGVTPLGTRWKTTTDLATAFGLPVG